MQNTKETSSLNGGRPAVLDALVIGAGFSGLYQLLCLRDRLGLSVKVLEAGARSCRMGSANAAVLPVPVCAPAIRSRPASTRGIACSCTGVGLS